MDEIILKEDYVKGCRTYGSNLVYMYINSTVSV